MKTILPVSNGIPASTTTSEAEEARPLSAEELSKVPFFAAFDPEMLARIAPHTKAAHFNTGDEILAQGDAADRFYVVGSGRVRVTCNLPDLQLHVIDVGPGEVVGFSWLFTPEKVHFTANATEPVKAVFVYGTLLQQEFETCPQLGYEFAMRIGQVMLKRLESVVEVLGGVRFAEG